MSLNVSGSKYVRVYNPAIRLNYSDKVVFADLVSSRKTGNVKVDKDTGEVVVNSETGKEVPERAFSRWEGKFVGNAFEPSKGLRDGTSIDIISGWVTHEPFKGADGKDHAKAVVTILEFSPSDVAEGEDIAPTEEE